MLVHEQTSAATIPVVHLPSLYHRTTIDIKSMMEFFTVEKIIEEYNHHHIFPTFEIALDEMANEKELRVDDGSENTKRLKEYAHNLCL